jgi:CheY-like chemotaxis protein
MPQPAIVLLVEDREDDVLLIRHAFQQADLRNPLYIVRDGEEAIMYLKGEGRFANRAEYPLPDLLLLDLNMPKVDGFEVLQWIRQQPGLELLRILVLTSSERIYDVNKAYRLGANSFLVKPNDFEDFKQLSTVIKDFWLQRCKAPETFRPRKLGANSNSQGDTTAGSE